MKRMHEILDLNQLHNKNTNNCAKAQQ